MMQNIKNFLVITVPTMLVLIFLLELFFRFVIPACTPPQNFFGENDLIFKFAPNQTGGIYSVGWAARHRAQWRINNHGWNSPIDYDTTKTRPRIAVIGDSYVEAMQVAIKTTPPSWAGNSLEVTTSTPLVYRALLFPSTCISAGMSQNSLTLTY